MPLSKAAEAHAALNASIGERFAQNPDLTTIRDMNDQYHTLGAEIQGVTYEEIHIGSLHALWAKSAGIGPATRAILYLHGGGFNNGSSSSHRKLAGHLAAATSSWVLVLDYRLTPGTSFPAPLDDCVQAYKWLLDEGYHPSRIVTCGDSAGGNMAVTTPLKLRDEGIALPAAMVSISPWVDMELKGGSVERNIATDMLVRREGLVQYSRMFLGSHSPKTPLYNPLYADLRGLPPLYVVWSTAECLADDAVQLVNVARSAGLDVTEEPVPDVQHVHLLCAGKGEEADRSIANIAHWLKGKFSS